MFVHHVFACVPYKEAQVTARVTMVTPSAGLTSLILNRCLIVHTEDLIGVGRLGRLGRML